MLSWVSKTILIFIALFALGIPGYAQTAADNTPMARPGSFDKESYPNSIRDSLEKMRIEREKKEFDRMIERGEQVARIAAELESAMLTNGQLSEEEKAKLASVEKLTKQIRSDLGGGDDDDSEKASNNSNLNIADAVRTLKVSTENLFKELKKTSRFTVSAAAIYSSNTVLRLARFMRIAQ